MSPQQLISFLLHTPALSQQLPDNTRAQLSQLQTLMETSTKGTALTPAQMGTLLGMKENDVRLLYALYDVTGENSRYFTFTLEELIDALLQKDALSSFTGGQNQDDLQTAQSLIHHTLNETRFPQMNWLSCSLYRKKMPSPSSFCIPAGMAIPVSGSYRCRNCCGF